MLNIDEVEVNSTKIIRCIKLQIDRKYNFKEHVENIAALSKLVGMVIKVLSRILD